MKKKIEHKIENINLQVNNGDPICIPCLLKEVKVEKVKTKESKNK